MQTWSMAYSFTAARLLLFLTTSGLAAAQGPCGWNDLDGGMLAGTAVRDLAVYDDGSGPRLYAGGNIGAGADVGIRRWNGTAWDSIGAGLGTVASALAVFDDGGGAAIYAAADSGLRKWSGGAWSLVPSPFNGQPVRLVTTLDDGSGPELFAVADYGAVASFDGSQWTTFPALPASGPFSPSFVSALTWFDRGAGPELYVGGGFTLTGGDNLARWNGTGWVAVGNALGAVEALAVHDDGSGPALWVGGAFSQIGGVAANRLARWDGVTWSAPATFTGSTSNTSVSALASLDDGSGPTLYVGGRFDAVNGVAAGGVARWNGAAWSTMAGGFDKPAWSFTVFDDGTGPHLFCGGDFTANATTTSLGVAKWSGAAWQTTGPGLAYDCPGEVVAACSVCEADGVALYAGGSFGVAGGDAARNIARWDGTSWSRLGLGVRGDGARVMSLHSFDDGNGPALFAGGRLDRAGSIATEGIARWDGASWSDVGGGIAYPGSFPEVHAMTTFDGGLGPELIVGGYFTTAGGLPASNIARWNGSSWSPLGSGVNAIVTSLTVCDLGAGDVLVAGGDFTFAGGVAVSALASWNGVAWAPLGPGFQWVSAVCVHDDGTGPDLFAAVGNAGTWSVVKHAGGSWTSLGSVSASFLPGIRGLAVADTPSGPALWVGGHFTQIAGVAAQCLAWWNGTSWTGANPGVTGWNTSSCASIPEVEALATYRQGGRDALVAGGLIGSIDGVACNGIGLHACVATQATFASFGVGCGGSIGVPSLRNSDCSLPWIGTQLDLVMDNLPPANPALMCFGLSDTQSSGTPLPASLAAFGMPGCTAYVSADVFVLLNNQTGTAHYSLQVPTATALAGLPVFVQGLVVDPTANPLGVVVSGAGAAILGN